MTKEEATKAIAEKLAAVNTLIQEAQKIADEHQVSFGFDGPTYGMGGGYTPPPKDAFEES